jgi:hypothetical protein
MRQRLGSRNPSSSLAISMRQRHGSYLGSFLDLYAPAIWILFETPLQRWRSLYASDLYASANGSYSGPLFNAGDLCTLAISMRQRMDPIRDPSSSLAISARKRSLCARDMDPIHGFSYPRSQNLPLCIHAGYPAKRCVKRKHFSTLGD